MEEFNSYLFRLSVHQGYFGGYPKQTVFGIKYRLKVFGMKDKVLKLLMIKKNKSLPVVLSKEKCKRLFAASGSLKLRLLVISPFYQYHLSYPPSFICKDLSIRK